ncbi:MAG: STM4013/SEN3800 family hydrolase [Verrucomicrobiota bacterium]
MKPTWDMNAIVASHDLLWVVLDSLRYDVACAALAAGETPNLARIVGTWEPRHTPATFTWAAHHAFFSGFLPTPVKNPRAPRLFAARFAGSQSTAESTFVFDDAYLIPALRQRGFHTVCIGGVGFFNKRTPIGCVFPGLFEESHWSPEMGPESRTCAEHQFPLAAERTRLAPTDRPLFLFLNVAAIHPPNRHYRGTPGPDDLGSHRAALRNVDAQLPVLHAALATRQRPTFFVLCSDHGTAYGESGYTGHRVAHDVVWTVPYAEGILPR